MTHPRAESIFLALSDVAPADRAALLDERCAGDAALRREVESLIAVLDVPDEDFLNPRSIPTLDMAAVDGPLQPGTRLGPFLVLHAIGSGGMGVVYAAQQDRPARTVAIKVLRRGYRHADILRRFEHEAEMLGRLQHPGIAQVYAFHPGDRSTAAHLVMELITGLPLTEYARAGQLSVAARVRLMIKLAEAMQHAHDRGIVHRDLKPANVLVAEGGQPKVLDFGVARAAGADIQRLTLQTAQGQLMGTLPYMSPEQLRGRPADIDARSDVYALGVLLYRLIADRLPFEVDALTWAEAVQHILESEPLPLPRMESPFDDVLHGIVTRAICRDVRVRYQTARDLAFDLEQMLQGRRPTGIGDVAPERTGVLGGPIQVGREIWALATNGVSALATSPDGRFVAVGFASGVVQLRDTGTGTVLGSFEHAHHAVTALACFSDGRATAAWQDGRVSLIAFDAPAN